MVRKYVFNLRSILSLVLVLCVMVPLSPRTYAASLDREDDEIQLYYTGTFTISASIEILSSGEAKCWGHVDCYPGYTAEADMRLQWLDGTIWRNYKSWSGEGNFIGFTDTYPIPEGRKYRVRVIADIYDSQGNWVEIVDAVSGSEEY